MSAPTASGQNGNEIAIVGMAAHLPGARDVRAYWTNLANGVESIRTYTDEELRAAKVPAHLLHHPRYVRAGAPIDQMESFDAEFFGFSPKEAAILDPQHRHFLETAWEALEDAGHPPERFEGSIGVFGGCGMGAYFAFNLVTNPQLVEQVGLFLLRHTGNDKDFLTTRVSYVLDLKGPSINVQTACSTSLVAVHMAAASLLSGECDMALAGGVTIELPHGQGYVFEEGEILSPDGHCRAFDHQSRGTVFGSGSAIVVLRRLADALEGGDHIYAVLKGSAVNNDGAGKVGYLAPSVDGQSAAIAEALAIAEVSPESIGYVECHGTGTPMGDPIEIAALTQAYRGGTKKSGYCAIGSVKSNIGHLDTAAGAAGLIKAALALQNGLIPQSLHFEAANSNIHFDSSPFFVAAQSRRWPRSSAPRFAAVNSLGVGGTNAHAILTEAPARTAAAPSRQPYQLLTFSARSRAALEETQARFANHLREHPELDLADAAYTLSVGRRAFEYRRVLAAKDGAEALAILAASDPQRIFTHQAPPGAASVVFMFPGGGTQHPRMGRGLFEREPVYREWMQRGFELLKARHGIDLGPLLFAAEGDILAVRRELERPALQLPALFLVEYALAQLWMSRGVQPVALIGHSMGENTAACVASVLSFEDALGLVVLRGRLFETIPEGGMLSVPLPAAELEALLAGELDLATVNAPALCVASGPVAGLALLERRLAERSVEAQRIPIAIAAHSRMLEPILEEFRAYLRSIRLHAPKIPFVSNRTGDWITPAQAIDPDYWVAHLRGTILFSQGVRTLLAGAGPRILLEVGPGRTLSSLARQQPDLTPGQVCISSLRHPDEKIADEAFLLAVHGRLWAAGFPLDTAALWKGEKRRRLPLPGYAFQRQRYWIEPGQTQRTDAAEHLVRQDRVEDWHFAPMWRERPLARTQAVGGRWLFFVDDAGLGRRLVDELRSRGGDVVTARAGDTFHRLGPDEFTVAPEHGRTGYDQLLHELAHEGRLPNRIVHLWSLTSDDSFRPGSSFFHRNQERGFWSLFFLGQALIGEGSPEPVHMVAVANGMQCIADGALRHPDKATLLGPAKVLPREIPGLTCRSVDVDLPHAPVGVLASRRGYRTAQARIVEDLLAEFAAAPGNETIVWRGGRRYAQEFERAVRPADSAAPNGRLRERGVVLITGGLGGLGLAAARELARAKKARLVLLGRSRMPERDRWASMLKTLDPAEPAAVRLRKLLELEALGAEVLCLCADVTDIEEMRAALAEARSRFGAIHGLLHTAGVIDDGLVAAKDQASVESVLAPKVHGTQVLDELLRGDHLDFFVTYSSTSAATAPLGQVDYVAANAFLNAFAQSRSPSSTYHAAVGWGVWSDVGMAAGALQARSAAGPRLLPARHPMFTTRRGDGRGTTVLESAWTAASQWVLDQHRSGHGTALLPGSGTVELARAALDEIGERGPFQIADLTFFRPLVVPDQGATRVRVRLEPDDEGFALDVQSLTTLDDGRSGWQSHAQARLQLAPLARPENFDLDGARARFGLARRAEPNGHITTRQAAHLGFGARWRVLRTLWIGPEEGLGEIALDPRFGSDLEAFRLHPALFDLATGFGLEAAAAYDDRALWVPVSYRRIRIHGDLPARIFAHARIRPARRGSSGVISLDATLTDPEGNVLVEVEDFAMKRLDVGADVALAKRARAAELQFDERGPGGDRPQSAAERVLAENITQGIPPEVGARELLNLIDHGQERTPIISSMDLVALVRQTELGARAARTDETVSFARPELDSAYVEPRDDLERTLVGYWQELLGVDRVGVEDSFFDLGGHSLIAVRLFAKIRKTFDVDYPISVLFEAPTVARVADLLRETLGASVPAPAEAGAAAPAPAARPRRYVHIVPMHPAEGSERTPFFLVAGMFGNVLNLRHLAGLVGRDRPVFGLQARGLFGDHEPHTTFEEAARDYLEELRSVQPNGPYILGGFSGGGLAAYEMAQQLNSAGEEVALLVLLDTPLPMRPVLTRADKLKVHTQNLRAQGAKYLTERIAGRLRWEIARFRRRFDDFSDEAAPTAFHSKTIEAAFRAALPRYRVQPFNGRVVLYRPKLDRRYDLGNGRFASAARELVYPDNGWSPFLADLEVIEVPGDHDAMVLEPNVRVLAGRLRRAIEQSEASTRAN